MQEGAENEEASAVNHEEQKQEEPEGQQPSQPVSGSYAKGPPDFNLRVTEAMEVEPAELKGFADIQDQLKFPKRNRSKPRQLY